MLPWWETRAKRIYIFSISPYRQRAFAKFFTHELVNAVRSGLQPLLLFSALAGCGYGATVWLEKTYTSMHRKNPDDYRMYYEEQDSQDRDTSAQ